MVCAKDARQVTKEPQPLGKTLVRRQRLVEQHGYIDVAIRVRASGCLRTGEVSQAHGVLLEKALPWLTESIQVHPCFFPAVVLISYACAWLIYAASCAPIACTPAGARLSCAVHYASSSSSALASWRSAVSKPSVNQP